MKLICYDSIFIFCPHLSAGPLQEYYESDIVPDNFTRTDVDLGRIGGWRKATAELKGNSLVTYMHELENDNIDLVAFNTVDPNIPDRMKYVFKDVASGSELVQILVKKNP